MPQLSLLENTFGQAWKDVEAGFSVMFCSEDPVVQSAGSVARVWRGKGEHGFPLWGRLSEPETCHWLVHADRKISDDGRIMSDLCPSAQIKAGIAPLLPARITA